MAGVASLRLALGDGGARLAWADRGATNGAGPQAFLLAPWRVVGSHRRAAGAGAGAAAPPAGRAARSLNGPAASAPILLTVALASAAALAFASPNGGRAGRRPAVRVTMPRPTALAAESSKAGSVAGDEEYMSEVEDDDIDDLGFNEDPEDEVYEEEKDTNRLEAVCKAKGLKGSPYKFRRVLWQIRGKSYREALMLLEFLPWRHCKPTLKALQSAAANAQNHFNMDKSRLYITRATANKGVYMKRMRPVAKGQNHGYVRKYTHLTIWVAEKDV